MSACAFAVLLTVGYEVQRHREETPALKPPVSLTSPEAQLATIQLGHRPRWRSSTVKRMGELLDLLAADCPEDSRRDLERLTTRSLRRLRLDHIAATPTEVLGGVVGLEDVGAQPRCAPYFERYVTSRQNKGAVAPG